MRAVTEAEIRASFVNASKGEAKRANLPDLDGIEWDGRDYFGWIDPKREQQSYATFVVETEDGDAVRTLLLRRATPPKERRKLLCSWCQDITATDNVTLYVAPRAGASGRVGKNCASPNCASAPDTFSTSSARRHSRPVHRVEQARAHPALSASSRRLRT